MREMGRGEVECDCEKGVKGEGGGECVCKLQDKVCAVIAHPS